MLGFSLLEILRLLLLCIAAYTIDELYRFFISKLRKQMITKMYVNGLILIVAGIVAYSFSEIGFFIRVCVYLIVIYTFVFLVFGLFKKRS
jgi:hypothetical protein